MNRIGVEANIYLLKEHALTRSNMGRIHHALKISSLHYSLFLVMEGLIRTPKRTIDDEEFILHPRFKAM